MYDNGANKMSYTIYKHTLILDCPHKGWSYIGQTHFKKVKIRWNSGKIIKQAGVSIELFKSMVEIALSILYLRQI